MSDVERIKERLGIVDVVSSYIKLEKAGMSYKARCPFHNEKTPSFHISPERNLYYCFGCGAKGDIFTFVQDLEGLDFQGSLKMLADKAGIELTGEKVGSRDAREKLYKIMEKASIFYSSELSRNDDAKKYLNQRGISGKTIKDFRIGLAPSSWTNLYDHLIKEGYEATDIDKAGLIKKSNKEEGSSGRFYDRFRNRIIFPISDSAGRIVAFSGRALDKGDKIAKYINSPETILYNKSDVLFGYDKAKQHIKKAKMCVLVEGQIDLILAHQEGFPYSVAVSGTSFTGGHLNRVRRLTDNLVIAFDRDKAGVLSMSKTARMALGMGMNVRTVLLPEGKDPADVLLENKKLWTSLINNSKHVIEVFLEQIAKNSPDQRKYWLQVERHVLPLISSMSNKIDQAHFISRVHNKTEIPEESIREELSKIEKQIEKKEDRVIINKGEEKEFITRKESITRALKAIVLWQAGSKKPFIEADKLRTRIDLLYGSKQDYELDAVDLQELIFQIEKVYESKDKLKTDIEELLLGLEEEILKLELQSITRKIKETEESNNPIEKKKLMERHKKLSTRLTEIKTKSRN